MSREVYIDMDGVLVDWQGAYAELVGCPDLIDTDQWPEGVYDVRDVFGEKHIPMEDLTAEWYISLKPTEECAEILEICRELFPGRIHIHSWHPDPVIRNTKLAWVQNYVYHRGPGCLVHIHQSPKLKMAIPASKNAIVIDDSPSDLAEYRRMGGCNPILIPRRWNDGVRNHPFGTWLKATLESRNEA